MSATEKTVYVGNLQSNINEATVRTVFSQCGQISNVKLAGDPSQPSRYAFVEFAETAMVGRLCRHLRFVFFTFKKTCFTISLVY